MIESQVSVFEKMNEVFRDVFEDYDITVTDETTADDIEDWDSLEHITLVVSMEREFDMKFDLKEVNKLANVGEMADLIASKL